MQTRPYPDQDGLRIWLSEDEQNHLLNHYDEAEYPRRRLALELGLCGLRSDEIRNVEYQHFRQIGEDVWKLRIPSGKTGTREVPVTDELHQRVKYLKGASQLRQDQHLIDVSTRSLRDWIQKARKEIAEDLDDDRWLQLGMHDLRRTWATDTYYTLAFDGVPIAEQLTMGWGGWKMTESGRSTFRENYLGPEPDYIAIHAF